MSVLADQVNASRDTKDAFAINVMMNSMVRFLLTDD